MPRLQEFLQDFCDNLEQEYPIPGFVPRQAQQHHIDIQSYTAWTIEIYEGPLGNRLPTEFALVTLDEVARQLGRHGPANLWFGITEGTTTYSAGFLTLKEFGGESSNGSLVNGNTIFQTS